MRSTLLLAAAGSISLHLVLLLASKPTSIGEPPTSTPPELPPDPFVLPIDLRDPEPVADEIAPARDTSTPTLHPPRQPDTFGPVELDDFIQPLQPPSPSSPELGPLTSIPTGPGGPAHGARHLTILTLDLLDQAPEPRVQTAPAYPFDLRRQGIDGQVVVGFIVDAQGHVAHVYVVDSTHREFEAAALQAVQRWKFRPGRKDGRPVAVRMQIPIKFNIDQA